MSPVQITSIDNIWHPNLLRLLIRQATDSWVGAMRRFLGRCRMKIPPEWVQLVLCTDNRCFSFEDPYETMGVIV